MTTQQNQRLNRLERGAMAVAVALASAMSAAPVQAQGAERRVGASTMLEEVVVSARKREESAQDVPLSVTAFNANQIEALKVRDLTNLSVGMPNVSLDDVGTTRGTANFSIRGMGINSSIPSIDPTVGVFVNGAYLGMNNGLIFDMFDLESVEVLRGPQGTLFGRNVTGGAVLLNTKKPGEELEGSARYALETGSEGGLSQYYMGALGGPVTDTVSARLVLYVNDDEGRFENDFTGDDLGAIEQRMARGTLVWQPGDRSEISLVYEYSDTDGEGAVAQSHTNGLGVPGMPVNHDRDGFSVSTDEPGYQETETNFLTLQFDHDVDFGQGTVTGIYSFRSHDQEALSDVDGQPTWMFHAPLWLEAEQNSLELRYNGRFADAANVTVGGFYFDNRIDYHERRELLGVATGGVAPAVTQDGGGYYDVESYTLFAQLDYDLDEHWTLTAGFNVSTEEKSAQIASLNLNTNAPCNLITGPTCPIDFEDSEDWTNVAPKLGATYHLSDASQLYGHWTRGFRSGGYNLRNVDPGAAPGPFDEEEVNNFELGYKSSHPWGLLNAAIFYMDVADQQREVIVPSETSGSSQVIRNTADTSIAGVEVDGTFSLTDSFILLASFGYIDASYDKVRFDLNGDGTINGADKDLELPRAPELTWSLGLTHDMDIGDWGYLTSRVSWSYRDEFAYSDNNLGYVEEVDIVDAGLDFYSNNGHWVFSVYGRNLLNEVSFGGDTALPKTLLGVPLGGTFAPILPGRRYGVEVSYLF